MTLSIFLGKQTLNATPYEAHTTTLVLVDGGFFSRSANFFYRVFWEFPLRMAQSRHLFRLFGVLVVDAFSESNVFYSDHLRDV